MSGLVVISGNGSFSWPTKSSCIPLCSKKQEPIWTISYLTSHQRIRYLIVPLLHMYSATQCVVTPPYTASNNVLYKISAHRCTYSDTCIHTNAHAHTYPHPSSTMSHLHNTDLLQTTHRLGKLKVFFAESIPCMLVVLIHQCTDLLVSSYV